MNVPKIYQNVLFGIAVIAALFGLSWAIIQIFTEVDTDLLWYKITYYGLQSSLLTIAFGLLFFMLRWIYTDIINE